MGELAALLALIFTLSTDNGELDFMFNPELSP